jgi:hypothetical protein
LRLCGCATYSEKYFLSVRSHCKALGNEGLQPSDHEQYTLAEIILNNYITEMYVSAPADISYTYFEKPGDSHSSTVLVTDYTLMQKDRFAFLNKTELMAKVNKY